MSLSPLVAIMAAILFPVFARARESARRAQCIGNVRQLGKGLIMYLQDHDETLPYFGTSLWPTECSTQIYPYVRNQSVYFCPSRRRTGCSGPKPSWLTAADRPCLGYAYNNVGVGCSSTYGCDGLAGKHAYISQTISIFYGRLLAEITYPANTFAFGESDAYYNNSMAGQTVEINYEGNNNAGLPHGGPLFDCVRRWTRQIHIMENS